MQKDESILGYLKENPQILLVEAVQNALRLVRIVKYTVDASLLSQRLLALLGLLLGLLLEFGWGMI